MKFSEAQVACISKFSNLGFIEKIREEDETMVQYLPILKEINEHGYLTFCSQAGREDKEYKYKERAFIEGFIQRNMAQDIIEAISLETDKIAVSVPYCEEFFTFADVGIPVTIDNSQIYTRIYNGYDYYQWMEFREEVFLEDEDSCDIVLLSCYDPIWGRNGELFNDVLRILKKIKQNQSPALSSDSSFSPS